MSSSGECSSQPSLLSDLSHLMIDITRIDDNLIENVDIGTCEKNLFKFESSLEVADFSILECIAIFSSVEIKQKSTL